MSRKPVAERDLCVYVAEVGDNGVKEEIVELIIHCIQDKIFSASEDTICVSRDDEIGDYRFSRLNWELLRKVENSFRNPRKVDSKSDPISSISIVCDSIEEQATCRCATSLENLRALCSPATLREDYYEKKKILYFTDLISKLNVKKFQDLTTRIEDNNIFLTIVVPDKKYRTAEQEDNIDILKDKLGSLATVYITAVDECTKFLLNTLSKKPKRPMAWNINLEIGPDMQIGVQAFIQSRKNTTSIMKTALEKNISVLPMPAPLAIEQSGEEEPSTSELAVSNPSSKQNQATSNDDIILTSKAIQKETIWSQDDGTLISPDQVIPAYYYGDRIVPFDETEQQCQFKSGDKCLKLLLFCPRENVWPCYLNGNGTDIIVANPKDTGSDLKLDALVHALHNCKRVAIVRKVRTSNARLALGVLAPNMVRKCLVYTELYYADDISMPFFVPLIKEAELASLNDGINEKDSIVDELIMSMKLDDFLPESGPVDPSIQMMRNTITRKILGKPLTAAGEDDTKLHQKDNIDIYFENLVKEDMILKIKDTFPLKLIPIKSMERPSGAQVFRKRSIDQETNGNEDKKIKIETGGDILAIEETEQEMPEYDNLLDYL